MGETDVKASIIIVNYEGRDDLSDCLPSVCDQTIDEYEIILVDNGSEDGSIPFVRENFPEVRILANEENRWYPGGNNDGMEIAHGEYIVVLNPDVEVEHDWLEQLVAPFDHNPQIGATTSRIVKFDDRSKLNTCGNLAHYTGLGFCRGLDKPIDSQTDREQVPAISGTAFAIRREVYEEIGCLDETFQMYYEDLDFSWRVRLAGYDIFHVPESVVYHKYELSIPDWKLFNMERNRYLILLKHLQRRTLLRLLPGLLLTEALVWMYAALQGFDATQKKAASWKWLWQNRETVTEKRKGVQAIRKRSDEELLAETNVTIPVEQFGFSGLPRRVLSSLVTLGYWPWHRLAING